MTADGYTVEVKRSARRANAGVGEWLRDHATRRTFDSKSEARGWADDLSDAVGDPVRVQDAPPHDDGDADGYLVRRGNYVNHRFRTDPPGEQTELPPATTPSDR